ncbi:hypothetical protein AAB992_05685 [Burkholderia contaminans]|uniref:hypothetical protein n=1 Tax=Burkholderia contaminans TaxID=488447 RepID=UPI002416B54D|nr:hypothetical protein [Burkholderia contaminans]WFN10083.1 hypothetical protein LXE92_01145 [Burkholderia contaminans]
MDAIDPFRAALKHAGVDMNSVGKPRQLYKFDESEATRSMAAADMKVITPDEFKRVLSTRRDKRK